MVEVKNMEAIIIIGFLADYNMKDKIEEVFNEYQINFNYPEKPNSTLDSEVYYEIPVTLNTVNNSNIISNICRDLKTKFNIDCGETVSFKFDDNDFINAPFYELKSTGNSSKAFLSHKNDGIKLITLCNVCKIQAKIQQSSLVMDTSKIGDRYMVNVGTDFWVVSEKMAALMEKWDITGYTLKEVIHSGKNSPQPVFQVIPTNILPPWSSAMKHYYFVTQSEGQCSECDIRGRIDYPYHYDKSDLEQYSITDISMMREWKSNGQWAYHPTFISNRFRRLLIENGITSDVRDIYAKNYKSKDWLFDPVIVVDN